MRVSLNTVMANDLAHGSAHPRDPVRLVTVVPRMEFGGTASDSCPLWRCRALVRKTTVQTKRA